MQPGPAARCGRAFARPPPGGSRKNVQVRRIARENSDGVPGGVGMPRRLPDDVAAVTGLHWSGRIAMAALSAIAVAAAFFGWLLTHRPPMWSPTWWCAALGSAVGLALTFTAFWRVYTTLPWLPWAFLVLDGVAVLLFWTDLTSPFGPLLLLLLSAVVAGRFRKGYLMLHIWVMLAALVGAGALGTDGVSLLFLISGLAGVIAVIRAIYLRFREQAIQTDHLRRLMELLPVLKARGVEDVVQAAVRHIVRATGSRTGVVLLLDEEAQVLRPHYVYSEPPLPPEEKEAIMNTSIEVGVGLSGWVAKHGQAILSNDAARDPRSLLVPGTPLEDESILVVPLIADGRLYGVLRVDRQGVNQYSLSDLHLLELMAAHVSDAISRAKLEERLARRDALTGVYNRHYLNEWSQHAMQNVREVSVLLIDLRKFKEVNDRWGHLTGDRVLQQCAELISGSVRSGDLVVRYGGDEFLVVLADTSRSEAEMIAARLQQRVAEWNARQGEDEPKLILDIGVDTAPQSEWQQLLDRADERMYACKHS